MTPDKCIVEPKGENATCKKCEYRLKCLTDVLKKGIEAKPKKRGLCGNNYGN